MYPFRDDNIYVRNTWYVAARRDEITRTPMERMICDEPIVFYRTESGDPVAMYGLCPHRYFPLAEGKLVGDAIQCGYHGFTFNSSGKCVRIPTQNDKGAGFSQRTYPVVEHGPWVWIWCGDPEAADVASLPDMSFVGVKPNGETMPGHAVFIDRCKPFAGRSQLIIDNLMDLTHFAYLHLDVVDSPGLIQTPVKAQPYGDSGYRGYREVVDGTWDAYCDFVFLPENKFETANFLSQTVFLSPALLISWSFEFTSVDGSSEIPPELGIVHYCHAITPATKHSSYYFQSNDRNFRIDDPEFHAIHGQMAGAIVDQDVAAAEAIEARLDSAAALRKELIVRADLPGIRVRDLIQLLIDKENSSESERPQPDRIQYSAKG